VQRALRELDPRSDRYQLSRSRRAPHRHEL
jgi:hypothetical protein